MPAAHRFLVHQCLRHIDSLLMVGCVDPDFNYKFGESGQNFTGSAILIYVQQDTFILLVFNLDQHKRKKDPES